MVLRDATGVDVGTIAGGGAAGGIPATLHALFNAEIVPGFELIAETVGLVQAIDDVDLIVTGEGSLDAQSLRGKATGALALLARARGVPVVVIAGSVDLDARRLSEAGIIAAFSLADRPASLDDLLGRAPQHARAAAARVGALISLGAEFAVGSRPTR